MKKRQSMKTKMMFLIITVFLTLTPICGIIVTSLVGKEVKYSIANQQNQSVERISDALDDKLAMIRELIYAVSQSVPPEVFANPSEALKFIQNRYTLKSLFDNGIFLFDKDGKLIAELPVYPPRVGADFSFREYIKQTVSTQKPFISDAYISSQSHHHPAIMFTSPVFSKNGELVGILGGSFDLMKSNFIRELVETKIGNAGYYAIIGHNRTIIMHQDKSRMMQKDVPAGANKLFDKAVDGFDGTEETVTSRGIEMLATYKHLKKVPWILVANYPKSEAYSSLKNMELLFWLSAILIGATVSFIVWITMQRFIYPIISLTSQIKSGGLTKEVSIKSSDETSELADAFNHQIKLLDESQKKLNAERELFQTLSDFGNDWIFWRDTDGVLTYSSPACEIITGYSQEDFKKSPELLNQIIHPDDLKRWNGHLHKLDDAGNPEAIQYRIITKQGETRWIEHVCRQLFNSDGNYRGVRGSNRDVTDAKMAEEEIYEQAANLEAEIAERQVAQEELGLKQKELEELNQSLENRVADAIIELREKEQMVINQSRLAAMGEMINNIAHQWRQPLNTLGLIIQNSKIEFDAGEMTKEKMAKDMEQKMALIQYMSRTIDDFRFFFKADKEKKIFNAAEGVSKAISLVSSSLNEHSIRIAVNLDAVVNIYGFPNEYSQVLLNLICNARDALLEKKVENPLITVTALSENGVSKVSIKDNGGGIPKDIIGRVFDPYFTTKEQGKGTGIGLYMSKIIIEKNMGGTLTVQNAEGGAEFTIIL